MSEDLDTLLSDLRVKNLIKTRKAYIKEETTRGYVVCVERGDNNHSVVLLDHYGNKPTCTYQDGTVCKAFMFGDLCYHVKAAKALVLLRNKKRNH